MIKTINNQEWLENELNWTPLIKTSANFTTHRLHLIRFHEMRSNMTLFYALFLLLFFVAGIGLLWFITFDDPVYRRGAAPFSGENIFGDLLSYSIGTAFTLFSGLSFLLDKKVVINRLNNTLSTGEKNLSNGNLDWPLDEIVAIQLLSKRCKASDDDYLAFELNAVFQNRKRVNLMTHGGLDAMIEDANRTSSFLRKPLFSNI